MASNGNYHIIRLQNMTHPGWLRGKAALVAAGMLPTACRNSCAVRSTCIVISLLVSCWALVIAVGSPSAWVDVEGMGAVAARATEQDAPSLGAAENPGGGHHASLLPKRAPTIVVGSVCGGGSATSADQR
ncbi:hypothetical protein OFEAOIEE_LOCUS4747 [Methylorubrum extorquens]